MEGIGGGGGGGGSRNRRITMASSSIGDNGRSMLYGGRRRIVANKTRCWSNPFSVNNTVKKLQRREISSKRHRSAAITKSIHRFRNFRHEQIFWKIETEPVLVPKTSTAANTAAPSTSTRTSLTVASMGGGNSPNGTTNGKFPIGGEANKTDIDEDLHSRQLAVYGRETMRQLFASNILVSGMRGLGAAIAKNLILAGVNSVTLHDQGTVELWDLSSNFIFTEDDLGKNRALASILKMQELNNSVVVTTLTTE